MPVTVWAHVIIYLVLVPQANLFKESGMNPGFVKTHFSGNAIMFDRQWKKEKLIYLLKFLTILLASYIKQPAVLDGEERAFSGVDR
jgi:hypothetical protein